jgi:zinc protease
MRGLAGTLCILLAAPGAHAQARGSAAAGQVKTQVVTAGAASPRDLKYPPRHTIQVLNVVAFTLPNGLKVSLLEDHELPVVGGIALIGTGNLLDPTQRIGLAQLAGTTLRTGGTNVKSGDQIDALLDSAAADMQSAMGDSHGTLSFTVLKESAPSTLQLFREVLTQPGFRQDKIDLARTQLRLAIAHRNDNAGAIAHREFAGLVYGRDTPFGWQREYATIDRVSRNDLRAFHRRYYSPANVMLGVWGDFDSAAMKASIEKLFADWNTQEPPAGEFPKVKNAPAPGIFLAEKKDAAQTYFTMGHLGGQRNDKDYAALEMLAGILGGGPRSRIAERLRTKLGITNEVSARWDGGYSQPGLFEISGSTKTVSTVSTIQAIEDELNRVRMGEVTEDELRIARDAALDTLAFSHDSRSKVFAAQLVLDYYGYPRDHLAQHQKALEAVTRADVTRAAKQYLNPANLTVVVVANPTMLGEPLEKLGRVTSLDLAIPEARPEVAPSSDASLAEGKRILLEAQAAAGGAGKLEAVKDSTMLAEYTIDSSVANVGGTKIVQTDKWVAPNTFRQEGTLPAGRVSAYTDGNVGWIAMPQGWRPLSGAQRSQALGDLFRVYFRLLLSDRIEGRTVNAIDSSSVQITDTTGQVAGVEFDPRTHLPKRVTYEIQQAAGAPLYSEDIYEDFRETGGIMLPYKITINQGGRKYSDVAVKEYRINTGLNPLELARRPQ